MEDRIVNGVVDRLFSRLSPEAQGNSPPVSLPGVFQRIISNPVLQDVEGELRNRFNTIILSKLHQLSLAIRNSLLRQQYLVALVLPQ